MRPLARALRRLVCRSDGAVSAETVIVMPLLIWALMSSFVFWDWFRTFNRHMKASFAVADMLTRENTAINMTYIEGMHIVLRHMLQKSEPTWVRVTSIRYRAAQDDHVVLWSRSTNPTKAPQMTDTMVADVRARIPAMSDDDTALIVETWLAFRPVANIALTEQLFHQFIVSRPRWLSPLPLAS